jgi:pantoate--beta-alanine ligase
MELYSTISALQSALNLARANGLTIGFVPTMGALHDGHLSLVDQAKLSCDRVVVSIFVNPTQFNDPNDLVNYPRTMEADQQMLAIHGCDYLFIPSVEEIYPVADTRKFDFGELETVMEGAFRPGHFNGVAQVVSRLFDIVKADSAFFGKKDFQQLAIIKALVAQLSVSIEIVACDIIREADGLAMSSRNKLLTEQYRAVAPEIFKTLIEGQNRASVLSVSEVKEFVINQLNRDALLKVEYFDIVDSTSLLSVNSWNDPGIKVGCIAVYAGKVRLIDNLIFNINV